MPRKVTFGNQPASATSSETTPATANIQTIDECNNMEEGKMSQGKEGSDADDSSSGSVSRHLNRLQNTAVITLLILFLGLVTSGAFLGVGITAAISIQDDHFERSAVDLIKKIEGAWEDYVNAAAMIHGRCRSRNFTREDFRDLYEYLIGGGLEFQAAQFDPNVTHAERDAVEQEAKEFYALNYPHIDYRGIVGFEYDGAPSLTRRSEQDFYFPIHYMEPVIGNEAAIDLDYHASGSRRRTVLFCMEHGEPALTDRLRLVQEIEKVAYGVVLMHPGYNLTKQHDVWPKDLASIVIRIPDLIRRSAENQGESSIVYIYDKSDSGGSTLFLGAAEIRPGDIGSFAEITWLPEVEMESIRREKLYHEQDIVAANKIWSVSVIAPEGTFKPSYVFVILGGVVIFLASVCLALWVHTNTRRVAIFNRMRAEAESEKAALILENARKAAKAERDLNDFIAHEVRNPVAAAMSACSFVKSELSRDPPLADKESIECTRDDVRIIDNALKFVNDLLRNMLDMHRAGSKQLKVNLTPTDILHDVLEPVQSMLAQRDGKVQVTVECKKSLWAMSDRLRLKQVILNLGRNSAKFVEEGFIRLKAEEIDDHVQISVEDSGPGIPMEKRDLLFNKFQESLDMLSQGTGVGLFLCKNLIELMGGEIYLDTDYNSGVPGNPGARFVVQLNEPPIEFNHNSVDKYNSNASGGGTGETDPLSLSDDDCSITSKELPASLKVLFVDDDPILRKLFGRTVRTVAPQWEIREASNGETALRLTDEEEFDLIFMDMYMASVEKQLLGTEAVESLRRKGIKCRICGLSANDKQQEFIKAGADVFTFKPFPCEAKALTRELIRVLYCDEQV